MSDKLEILYMDKDLAVCRKAPGQDSQALPRLLAEQEGGEGYCVHRLDKPVGGLILLARSQKAAARLSAVMGGDGLDKRYLAVLPGPPEATEGRLEDLLFHDKAANKTYVVKRQRKGVRQAALEYRVLERAGELSLVKVRLLTGRSHQIRVQFASRGLPLLGDSRYGSREQSRGIALLSHSLSFTHPVTGRTMSFESPPPRAFPWELFQSLWG